MSNMPGNVNKLSHEEAIGTHLKPETQTRGFQEYPKVVGETKPTEAEAAEAEKTGIPFKGKPIIAKSPEEEAAVSAAPTADLKPVKASGKKAAWVTETTK